MTADCRDHGQIQDNEAARNDKASHGFRAGRDPTGR